MSSSFTITATPVKQTPKAVRFKEDGDEASHKMGSPYVRKAALDALGHKEGDRVEITVRLAPKEA